MDSKQSNQEMLLKYDINDKVVFSTGSNSGIEQTTFLCFAKLGAKVRVTERDAHKGLGPSSEFVF